MTQAQDPPPPGAADPGAPSQASTGAPAESVAQGSEPEATPEEPEQDATEASSGWSGVLLAGTRDLAIGLPKKIFEIDFELTDSFEELRKKIAWIIRIRFAVAPAVVLLMLVTNWQGLTKGASALSKETIYSTALTAAFSIVINVFYFLALKRRHLNLKKFVFLQLVLDVIIFAVYIWRTGGVTSPFNFLYFLPIIGSSILLGQAAGMAMASISAAVYILVITLDATGVIPHVSYFVDLDQFSQRWSFITLMMIVNLFAFIVVGGASGFLIRQVFAKTNELKESNWLLERRADLFRMLYKVSEVLQQYHHLDDVLDRICDVLVTDMDVDRALMYTAEDGVLKLRRVAYHPRIPKDEQTPMRVTIPLDPKEGLTARCAVENQAFNVTDPSRFEGINAELASQIGLNPFALAPMTYRDRVLGVLGIDRSEQLGTISEDELEILVLFARQAGQTLASAQAHHRHSAHSDPN